MSTSGLLIVISSPSGGGKSTLCETLLASDRRLSRSISATTRLPRGQEKDGRDYYFFTPAKFDRALQTHQFLEWAEVHGQRYGTLKSEVKTKQTAGKDVVMVIDVQGGLAVKRSFPEAVLIFLKPPSFQVLSERLRGRGTDALSVIRKRLTNARRELTFAEQYDYVVVNQELEIAVAQTQAIILAERLRVRKKTKRSTL